jgi:hypothetical protein
MGRPEKDITRTKSTLSPAPCSPPLYGVLYFLITSVSRIDGSTMILIQDLLIEHRPVDILSIPTHEVVQIGQSKSCLICPGMPMAGHTKRK